MKNKKAQVLSIFLSACMLGTSVPVSAADFSAEAFSADESTVAETPSDISEDISEDISSEETPDSDSTDTPEEPAEDLFQTPEASEPADTADSPNAASVEDNFSTGDEEETFSDSDENDVFSSGEEGVQAGILDNSAEARMAKRNSVVEADIPVSDSVSTTCTIYEGSNLENQNYTNWSSPVESYLTTSPDGYLMRVQNDAIDGKLLIEYYDSRYNLKKTMTLDLSLPVFGAFYETGDSYYILTGANNTEKDDAKEVYRVSRYSKDWKSQGSCGLFGANTTYPFDAGSARITSYGKYLFVRTCHEMYNGHQANVTFSVDTSKMSIVDSFTGVSNTNLGYVSHSFNQFIQIDNGTLLGCDHGDAYPRAIAVLQYVTDISNGSFVPNYFSTPCKEIDLMTFPGSTGNNYTGASLGAFEYSDSSYLAAGNYDADNNSRNVFISSVSKSGGTPVVRYFSNYAGTSDSASTPHLVKTGNNSFVLLWSSNGYVYYTAIDGTGQQVGSTYKMAGNLSDCVPSIINGKLIWYTWKNSHNTFYEINLSDLSSNNAVRIENGHKYVYGTTIENYQIDKTCRVCGISSKAVVPSKVTARITPSGSNYRTLEKSDFLNMGLSYTITRLSWFSGDYPNDSDFLSDCIISSSDENVVSVNQTTGGAAVITPQKPGKATLTIQSKYNPDAVFTSELYVDMLSEDVFTFSNEYVGYYNGTDKTPDVHIYRSGLTLQKDTDYTVTVSGDTINAGTFTMTFTGIGKYTGSVTRKYTIKTMSILTTNTTCTLTPSTCIYDGKPAEPKVTIVNEGNTLVEGKDFTVEYKYNTAPGRARAGITGIGNYRGYFTTTFYISYGNISNCDVSLSDETLIYDGTAKKPAVTVKCNGNTLTEGTHYTLSYRNNVNAGTASVTITGKGNYSGTLTKTFKITANALNKCTVQLSASSFTYDGTEKKPNITVTSNGKKLSSGTDYTVSYKNNVNAGTATVTVAGTGNYTGKKTATFQIARAKATLTVKAATLTLNQSTSKTAVIKSKKTDGKITLKSSNSKIVKISGTSIIPLSPGKATVTVTAAQGKNYKSASAKLTITVRPLNTGSVSLKSAAKGQANVSWKSVKSITAYQIQYSTSSNFKSAKTVTVKGSSRSTVLKKLTRGKKYYIRIRTYKTVSKKNYYSTWSKTSSVKVK